MEPVQIVGTVGAIASVSSFAPQAIKIIRERRTQGLSPAMFLLTCSAFLCWTTYGALRKDWALILPNAACLALATFILVMILLPPRKTREVAEALDPTS